MLTLAPQPCRSIETICIPTAIHIYPHRVLRDINYIKPINKSNITKLFHGSKMLVRLHRTLMSLILNANHTEIVPSSTVTINNYRHILD